MKGTIAFLAVWFFALWGWCRAVDLAFDRFDRWRYRKWPQYDARSLTEKSKP